MDNTNLIMSKTIKNDDFYTFYDDIDKEVSNYIPYFRDKKVLCCMDSPKSNFWKFFVDNFFKLKIRKVVCISVGAVKGLVGTYQGGDEESYNFLEGDGDFRSEEVKDFIRKADIVVTNPPFSLFRDFVKLLEEMRKDYLIIGNKNALTYNDFFNSFINQKVRIGYNNVKNFYTPTGEIKKFGNICWFTTLPVQEKPFLNLVVEYDKEKFLTYENYPAIDVQKLKDIPKDYNGIIGVPLTFLEHWSPRQFDILGKQSDLKHLPDIKPLGEDFITMYRGQGGKGHFSKNMYLLCFIDREGKARIPYGRVLIRKKR